MNNELGFDNEKYLKMQSEHIHERILKFGNKLYLELGGKLFDDYHASRVLPGFKPDSKINMLAHLADKLEIVVAICALDIVNNKVRGDHNITYDLDVLRLIDAFRKKGFYVGSVVITQYNSEPAVVAFKKRLESMNIKTYLHYPIDGYPANVSLIVSEEGLGKNEYIETQRPLVVVTAPGPGSGKMATCLSQLYHENKRGIKAGYAKFETFPIWNLPIKHPVNLAYEAATADIKDMNMIDPFHLEAYGITTVNYNRDIEVFPVLNAILEKILGSSPYKSPTDMGVNMAGNCIINDEVCRRASLDEIIRRYYNTMRDERKGRVDKEAILKTELIMNQAKITTDDRPVVAAALRKSAETDAPATAIQLNNGAIITGKTTPLLGASAACILNVLKSIAGIDDDYHLISPTVIEPIQNLKIYHFGNNNPRLHIDETLIALSICATSDPLAKRAFDVIPELRGLEAHSSVILSQIDESIFKKLGMNLTCEPLYQSKKLYHT